MAFDSAGTLYAVTGDGATTGETLYTVNTTTAAMTFFLTLGNGSDGEAIAFNPDDGLMYHMSGLGTKVFETINLTTMAVTPITHSLASEHTDFCYDASGTFFGLDIAADFHTLTTAGASTSITTLATYAKGIAIIPHITSSTTTLALGTTPSGTSSTPVSFDISGTHLVGDIAIATPTGVVVSLTMSGGYGPTLNLTPTSGTVATTTIYVRMQASAPVGSITGNLDLTTTAGDTVQVAVTGTVTAPPTPTEIDIQRPVSTSIPDGGTDTITTPGVATVAMSPLTYTIENLGGAPLNLTGTSGLVVPSNSVNCGAIVVDPTTNPFAGSDTFTVTITPSAAGSWSVDISIDNDDADENPYNFTISGTATATAEPEIEVQDPGAQDIANGGSLTAYGAVAGAPLNGTFFINNIGSATLNITAAATSGDVNGTSGITFATPATVASAASTTFDLTFTPTAAGTWSFLVTLTNDDADEGSFTFTVTGTAQAVAAPEIAVRDAADTDVVDGSSVGVNGTGTSLFSVTYTIRNEGAQDLNLTNTGNEVVISNMVNCTVSVTQPNPTTLLAASGGATESQFALSVTPTGAGLFSFDISIANDDADENPFNWTFNGNTAVPSSGGGGGDDGGCAVGTSNTNILLVMLGLLGLVAVSRLRREAA
jgi:hypothetical protein